MDNKKLKLIINPNAGKGKAEKLASKIKEKFEESGFIVYLKLTEKRDDATNFAKQEEGEGLIVCVGGDGTLHEVVNGVMMRDSRVPIGYIPLGSVNDFARSVGIPKRWKRAVKNIIEGSNHDIDVCKFNDTYFTYVAAAGIFTKMAYTTSQKLKNKLGKIAYFIIGARDIVDYQKMHLKVEADGIIYEDDFLFVAVANTRSIGSIIKLKGPYFRLNDGQFELLLIKYPKNVFKLARAFKYYNSGKWNTDDFRFIHAKEVRVYDRNNVSWVLDGEESKRIDDVGNITHISVINKGITIRTRGEKI